MRSMPALLFLVSSVASAQTPKVPPGFELVLIPGSFTLNVALAPTPDGRVFFSDKSTGRILVIKNGAYLPTPLIDKAVNYAQERGALGVTIDPDFGSNHQVYFFYTESSTGLDTSVRDSVTVNKLIRFTEDADTLVAGSEVLLRQFPINPSSATHNSGNVHFGPDGKLLRLPWGQHAGEPSGRAGSLGHSREHSSARAERGCGSGQLLRHGRRPKHGGRHLHVRASQRV